MVYTMLLEIYFTFLRLVMEYGDYRAMLIMAFLTSLPVFALAAITKLALKNLKPWWFAAFLATELYFFLAQLFLAFWYHVQISIIAFFEPATYIFLLFAAPLAMVYRKLMEEWPSLPWHLIIYLLSLLGSLVFWYFLVFVYKIFELAPPLFF